MIKLYQHQEKALELLTYNNAYALFMEAGTGKTLVMLFHIYNLFQGGEIENCLIISPAAVKDAWYRDIEKLPKTKREVLNKIEVVSYDTVWRQEKYWHTWDCIVLDESHCIASPSTKRTKFIKKLKKDSKFRYILTGTPIHNKKLEDYLNQAGAVLVTGPKYCGKTFISKLVCQSNYFLSLDDASTKMANYNVEEILNGAFPRLIDEWQCIPIIWHHIKRRIDDGVNGQKRGLYVLTGSTKPADKNIHYDSAMGRIYHLKLATLTFAEILDNQGKELISLSEIANDASKFKTLANPLTHDEVNQLMIQGGWPELFDDLSKDPITFTKQYLSRLVEFDAKLYKFRTNKIVLKRILASLARLNGSQINRQTILKDINQCIDDRTLLDYLDMLNNLEVIFEVEPWWNLNLRSKYKMRTKPKTYFCDTSLVCRLLEINHTKQMYDDLNTTGLLFENQVMKDLNVYASALNGDLYFYRDEQGNEIDAIIEFSDGSWWAIEIKLSKQDAYQAAKKLDELYKFITFKDARPEPALKLVITDSDESIKLSDNLFIIPHTLIKPI